MLNGYTICNNKWALDRNIKDELGLLIIIAGLSRKNGYCYATNTYLANLFNVSKVTISRKLKKLIDYNYITINYIKKGNRFIGRQIRVTKMLIGINKFDNTPINKNVKEIIINNKNKIKYISNFTARKYENLNMFYSNWEGTNDGWGNNKLHITRNT